MKCDCLKKNKCCPSAQLTSCISTLGRKLCTDIRDAAMPSTQTNWIHKQSINLGSVSSIVHLMCCSATWCLHPPQMPTCSPHPSHPTDRTELEWRLTYYHSWGRKTKNTTNKANKQKIVFSLPCWMNNWLTRRSEMNVFMHYSNSIRQLDGGKIKKNKHVNSYTVLWANACVDGA